MCALPIVMGERKGGIEVHGRLEETLVPLVFIPAESVQVPQTAVICLPGIQRVRRPQDRAVTLDRLDLVCDGRDDPVPDLVEDEKGLVELLVEDFRPDDPRGAGLGTFDRYGDALADRKSTRLNSSH